MATHEELALIRDARMGLARSQLELGRRYLDGSDGLPMNTEAALHWLAAAAMQDDPDACVLIARNFTLEQALQSQDARALCIWYERAFSVGETQAGLSYAALVLERRHDEPFASLYDKALSALCAAAHSGLHEAEWLWAKVLFDSADNEAIALEWTTRAALGGVVAACHELAQRAWKRNDFDCYLQWAFPQARQALRNVASARARRRLTAVVLTAEECSALSRCARILATRPNADAREVFEFWELAALQGSAQEQYALGLWLAKMNADGEPVEHVLGPANYVLAIQWLILAGQQGLADAWFSVSKIYAKRNHAHANPELMRHYRHKAAEQGHRQAQYECGLAAWNESQARATNIVRAIHWLELASEQSCEASDELLRTIQRLHPKMFCNTLVAEVDEPRALFTV